MLTKLDLGRIAKSLRSKGYDRFEIFAEISHRTLVKHQDRNDSVQLCRSGGISVQGSLNGSTHYFNTSDFSTAGVLKSIAGEKPGPLSAPVKPHYETRHPQKFVQLTEFYRSLSSASHEVSPLLTYEEEFREFEVLSSDDDQPSRGEDEKVHLNLQWYSPKERKLFRIPWHRRSVEGLLSDLSGEPALRQTFYHYLAPPVRWPLPSGEVDTVWSSLAFSKLLLPLIRLCEADQNFGNDNFWEKTGPLPDWFSLSDSPEENARCDFQGVARKPTPLVEKGKLARFACNRGLAGELNCLPTGHGRRESFTSPVGVGLWNAKVDGPRTDHSLVEALGNGIFVGDIELLGWQPSRALCRVLLREGRLVHHGELGEYLEPLAIDIALPRLLHSCAALGPIAQSRGFRISKPQGRHITEVSTPDALTAALPYPGQVPPSHYW